MYVFSYLEAVREFEIKGDKLVLFFASKFHRDGVNKNKELIESVLAEVLGRNFSVGCEFKMFFGDQKLEFAENKHDKAPLLDAFVEDENAEKIPPPKDEDNSNITEDAKLRYTPDEVIEKEKIVKDVLDIFGGELLAPDK